ncbi:hypothetical protein UFOVP785_33 [uncultured Caudovirales phage]|uniref:Uncharacterized protein n=1 Tax=uncultured Caudovirales phage TaxID=2100421 RepID=A0A6J5NYU7_9CAUD|nr:hypothetical protein UFOVP785_33 [uncultured Caudovirales phage]
MSDLGSMCVVRGGSSITTLPQYLASIGKNSFYARFVAGTNMFVNADLTGGAVALNGTVGSWQAEAANTSNFTAYFAQSASGDRPLYAAANGINSLYASGNATGDTRYMDLNSTTALNGNYTVIARHPLLARDSKTPFSHNGTAVYWVSAAGGGNMIAGIGANGVTAADQVTHVIRNVAGTSSGNCIIGVSQTGTGHNGFAPRLFRRTTAYSASAISELWFMPVLTDVQLDAAMAFIS